MLQLDSWPLRSKLFPRRIAVRGRAGANGLTRRREDRRGSRPTRSALGSSVLLHRTTWKLLLGWAMAYGVTAGTFEAVLAGVVPDVPVRPWHALLRTVQAVLWTLGVAIAIAASERWPIRSLNDWRRILAQVGIGLVVGPAWGVIGYALAEVFMPWRRAGGVWGIIAIDAKGMLFAYGTAVVVAHVVLRAREQRARAVAIGDLQARAAEARVRILTLGLQSEGVLATLDAIIEKAPIDPEGANESLVQLADVLGEVVEAARARSAAQQQYPHGVHEGVRDRRSGDPAGALVHPSVRHAGDRGQHDVRDAWRVSQAEYDRGDGERGPVAETVGERAL